MCGCIYIHEVHNHTPLLCFRSCRVYMHGCMPVVLSVCTTANVWAIYIYVFDVPVSVFDLYVDL